MEMEKQTFFFPAKQRNITPKVVRLAMDRKYSKVDQQLKRSSHMNLTSLLPQVAVAASFRKKCNFMMFGAKNHIYTSDPDKKAITIKFFEVNFTFRLFGFSSIRQIEGCFFTKLEPVVKNVHDLRKL